MSKKDLNKRNFYLKNKDGEIKDLLYGVDGYKMPPFFHEPQGLGFSLDFETIIKSNRKVITSVTNNFEPITGQLFFGGYEEYRSFCLWIEFSQKSSVKNRIQPIKLFYETTLSENEFFQDNYYDVVVKNFQKGEKNEYGYVVCDVEFEKLSNIKKEKVYVVSNLVGEKPPTTFPLPTTGSAFIKFGGEPTNELNLVLDNPSNMQIPCQIQFKGVYTDPYWHNKTNNLKGQYLVTSELESTVLIAEARPFEYVTENGVNIFNKLAAGYTNLLFLEPGDNKIDIKVNATDLVVGYCEVTISYEVEALSL